MLVDNEFLSKVLINEISFTPLLGLIISFRLSKKEEESKYVLLIIKSKTLNLLKSDESIRIELFINEQLCKDMYWNTTAWLLNKSKNTFDITQCPRVIFLKESSPTFFNLKIGLLIWESLISKFFINNCKGPSALRNVDQ